jgi:hypothetical protein
MEHTTISDRYTVYEEQTTFEEYVLSDDFQTFQKSGYQPQSTTFGLTDEIDKSFCPYPREVTPSDWSILLDAELVRSQLC